MTDERTPKPNTVKTAWVRSHPFPLSTSVEDREAEFDRMIAAVERAAAAKALQEVTEIIDDCLPHGQYERFDDGQLLRRVRALTKAIESGGQA